MSATNPKVEQERPSGPRGLPVADQDELITVVIPARNEERFIARCLDSVLAQEARNLQVVVVDGASEDRTPDIVRQYAARDPRVELLSNPDRIVPISLNIGARAARSRWFVRIDAHATVPPDYVGRAVGHLRSGRWGGVGGRVDCVGVTPAGRAIALAMGSRFGIGNSIHHYGNQPQPADHVPFPAYPVALIHEIGGWDDHLAVNQDFEFDYRLGRAGHKLLYDPNLSIAYHGQQSIRGVFRQFRRYGSGKVKVLAKHPESVRARHFAAPALVAWSVAATAVALRRPKLGAAAVAPYLGAVAAVSLANARKLDDGADRVRLPLAFAAMHVGWGLGFWEGVIRLVRGRRPGSPAGP